MWATRARVQELMGPRLADCAHGPPESAPNPIGTNARGATASATSNGRTPVWTALTFVEVARQETSRVVPGSALITSMNGSSLKIGVRAHIAEIDRDRHPLHGFPVFDLYP